MSGRCDDCCGPKELAHASTGYRRALAIVIALNLGMGVAEMIGGLLGASQALKADALDFLGDGSITLLGFLALSWRPVWRAQAALMQGIFLGALGLGVVAAALYRTFVQKMPEAGVMGAVGLAALATNLIAALILIPYRKGDANARAVWLFSRNDALGNVAVIAAGGLVYWTGTPWPDLIAAFAIAALFLDSARTILREALGELRAIRGALAAPRVASDERKPSAPVPAGEATG